MLKVISSKNNNIKYIKCFITKENVALNSLDACGCTGNGAC